MVNYQNTIEVQENYDNAIEPENHICYRAYLYKINDIFSFRIFTKFKFVLENINSSKKKKKIRLENLKNIFSEKSRKLSHKFKTF